MASVKRFTTVEVVEVTTTMTTNTLRKMKVKIPMTPSGGIESLFKSSMMQQQSALSCRCASQPCPLWYSVQCGINTAIYRCPASGILVT